MADIKGEPKALLKKRIQAKIAELNYQVARIAQRREEILWEMQTLEENEKATGEAIVLQNKQLEDLGL